MATDIKDRSRHFSLLALYRLKKDTPVQGLNDPKLKEEMDLEQKVLQSYSENDEIRQFEEFGSSRFGTEIERKHLTQCLCDAMDTGLAASEKLAFSQSQVEQEVSKFLVTKTAEQERLLAFASANPVISSQTQAEILGVLQEAYNKTDLFNPENPFYKESLAVQKLQSLSDRELLKNLSRYRAELYATGTGKDSSVDFDFYKNEYEKSKLQSLEGLARNLKADLLKSLYERHLVWQLEMLDRMRREYLNDLYKYLAWLEESLGKIRRDGNVLSAFMDPDKIAEMFTAGSRQLWNSGKGKSEAEGPSLDVGPGQSWGLGEGNFADSGFQILSEFAELLEKDESLKELADLIGRQDEETEKFEKELREKTEIKVDYHPKAAYRGQISGLRLSGEITSTLPSELAMSQNPVAKLYFAQKFAESKLLSYAYINRQKTTRLEKTTEEEESSHKEKETKGPVIICVDTSGSMQGTPEQVAKTITFALAKKCLEEGRGCYLISFSEDIAEKNLADFSKGNGLMELINFISMSFNGWTEDAPAALERSIELLQQNSWKNADVLTISDMIMVDFSEKMKSDIKKQQEEKTKFYSLVIGSSGNSNVIDVFDENWSYDTESGDSMRHLVRHIHSIGSRNTEDRSYDEQDDEQQA